MTSHWKRNYMEWRDCGKLVYHDPHFYPQSEQPLSESGLRGWYYCGGNAPPGRG